ncbi:MAG: hypothetical protein A2W00_01735 [Candidatus Eisenbacteria bacterium RBG_16_71_46]|nr:MAG: hypothetical protein A2W00_01735 [Candidatus Eisenbacteria bacterium RBG_16_71_46]
MTARDRLSWFNFSPGDYMTDPAVRAMSYEQRGRYVDVLCAMYLRNSGSATEDEIRVWAGCSEDEWKHHREGIQRAFKVTRNGRWIQKRVEVEVREAKKRVEQARKSGREGAKKRWGSMGLV